MRRRPVGAMRVKCLIPRVNIFRLYAPQQRKDKIRNDRDRATVKTAGSSRHTIVQTKRGLFSSDYEIWRIPDSSSVMNPLGVEISTTSCAQRKPSTYIIRHRIKIVAPRNARDHSPWKTLPAFSQENSNRANSRGWRIDILTRPRDLAMNNQREIPRRKLRRARGA